MIEGKDFKFRDDMKLDTVPIEILLDSYKGVVYHYQKLHVVENEDETATMKFEYKILDTGNFKKKEVLEKDPKFQQVLGLILNKMLLDIAEHEAMNENRTDDTEELIEE